MSKCINVFFWLTLIPCILLGQKVVCLKGLINDSGVYFRFEDFKEWPAGVGDEIRDAIADNGSHLLLSDKNFIRMETVLSSSDSSFLLRTDQKSYPILVIKNLQTFPYDTIFINGLELKKYPSCLSVKSLGSVRRKGQKNFHRNKAFHSYNIITKNVSDSISYPNIQINGADAKELMTLKKDTITSVAHLHGRTKLKQLAWEYIYEIIEFTLIVDIKDVNQLKHFK